MDGSGGHHMNAQLKRKRARTFTACDEEPIHVPGHIQPHGVLIATYPNSTRISHVSGNLEASTGIAAAEALNAELGTLLGPDLMAAVSSMLEGSNRIASNIIRLKLPVPKDPLRSVTAHRHAGRTIIELEMPPAHAEHERSLAHAQLMIMSLRNAETVEELCGIVTREIRTLIGCDRAMVYRFDPDGHGMVIAEDHAPGLQSFLNLHYPAGDIPQQARRLYKLQRVRGIPDMHYVPQRLLAASGAGAAGELDMTHCALRGVSPIHREYMDNMHVRATLAVSLMHDTELWGMIVCHHGLPLGISPEIRAFCDVIGQMVSMLLQKVTETEQLSEKLRRYRTIAALRSDMEGADNVARALWRQSGALLDLMHASGAFLRIGDESFVVGEAPAQDVAAAIVNSLQMTSSEDVFETSSAGVPGGIAADFADTASGILLMPILNNPGDAIAWFRRELPRTVQWAGEPEKAMSADSSSVRIAPRKSFAAWSEVVRGRSEPWSVIDVQTAGELRRTITSALLRHAEMKLAQLSAYDPLTNLANRRTLKARLEQCRLEGTHQVVSMLFFDLDRFKMINDSLGHAAGDQVLIQVAARILAAIPPRAMAARMGRDEFVVFLPGSGKLEAATLADAIMHTLSRPLKIQEQDHYITVSVGIACSGVDGVDQLLREADEAMYAAKRQGGGRSILFQPSLHATVLTANQIQQDLFTALQKNELEIHYQPIVRVPGREIAGFEALVRWRHAVRGWISPAEFIPRAEETGLIKRIGTWVFARAVRQLAEWQRIDGDLSMSINVSARQLTEGAFSAFADGVLRQEQVAARSIIVEVTESALMQDSAVRELHRLRELGIRVAVDDFGTGYSSLAYLQSLPVDIVKLDRTFVSRLGTSVKADAFFAAVLSLAHTLDIGTVAEGCETEEQWEVIEREGCKAVQGWLIARALDANGAAAFLERRRADRPRGAQAGAWGETVAPAPLH
jgi:diguanylate cyclase (GGDEF)-like protein